MRTFQRESGTTVVEIHVFPSAGNMTGSTIRAKLTHMCIFGRVACITILWRAFIQTIYMTGFTNDIHMQAVQRESRAAMIEGRRLPGINGVTLRAGM